MAGSFTRWARFQQNFDLTRDPHKALRWAEHQARVEKEEREAFRKWAEAQVAESCLRADGFLSKKST